MAARFDLPTSAAKGFQSGGGSTQQHGEEAHQQVEGEGAGDFDACDLIRFVFTSSRPHLEADFGVAALSGGSFVFAGSRPHHEADFGIATLNTVRLVFASSRVRIVYACSQRTSDTGL